MLKETTHSLGTYVQLSSSDIFNTPWHTTRFELASWQLNGVDEVWARDWSGNHPLPGHFSGLPSLLDKGQRHQESNRTCDETGSDIRNQQETHQVKTVF